MKHITWPWLLRGWQWCVEVHLRRTTKKYFFKRTVNFRLTVKMCLPHSSFLSFPGAERFPRLSQMWSRLHVFHPWHRVLIGSLRYQLALDVIGHSLENHSIVPCSVLQLPSSPVGPRKRATSIIQSEKNTSKGLRQFSRGFCTMYVLRWFVISLIIDGDMDWLNFIAITGILF